ncbi:hypothetical protein RvY_14383 [Ramazzottius varieornatus]|uniref:Uncharacterized protein n=1 Tax=Ramazzottius varieornatus TaxID=947166 RepID=A0A1D1VR53_RAMVA|nr:hypothetical protein RvY_14383 [Ramazzottius varieornatus]
MNSVNPFNILKLLWMDYEQDFQPNDFPSDHDKLLNALFKGAVGLLLRFTPESMSAITGGEQTRTEDEG